MRVLLVGALSLAACLPPPHEVAAPSLPPGAEATGQDVALRCRGEPERLDCEATTRLDTRRHGTLRTQERWRSRPTRTWDVGLPAPVARHPLMAQAYGHAACRFAEDGCWHRIRVPLLAAARRDDGYRHRVRVSAGEGFNVSQREGQRGDGRQHVDVSLRSKPDRVSPGGPFLAFGGRLGGGAAVGRVGWESFAPASVAHALSVEAGTNGDVTLAYVPSMVTGQWLMLPSLALGLGLYVQVAPALATGPRLQASLAFPVVGLVAWMDLLGAADEPARGYLAGQLSF